MPEERWPEIPRPASVPPSVEAERLDAIGGMAAGVTHHLNNILTVALGNIQLTLKQGVEDRSEVCLRAAEGAVRDAVGVLRSLTTFCRTDAIATQMPLDLNRLVDEVLELTAPRWRDEALARDVRIRVQVERGDLEPLMANAVALRQVLMNLIFNGVEAMPDGGLLTLRTWADDVGFHVSVSDTGIGMDDETRARALEPFVTTKGSRSRGLGLSVAHRIVTRHGGRLDITTLPGVGTCVVMSLPRPGAPALT
jgi:signal transduction histidine kinase